MNQPPSRHRDHGLTPISTRGQDYTRFSESPSRATHSSQTSFAANRQSISRQSSPSSGASLASPSITTYHATSAYQPGQRPRAPTSHSSPRLVSSFTSLSSLSQGASGGLSGGGGGLRLVRHSPSHSTASSVGSPVSSTGGSGLLGFVNAQLQILLKTINSSNFDVQAEKIRKLVDENGMEAFETYFRRTLNNCWSLVFPNAPRPGANNQEAYQLVHQEVLRIVRQEQQASKVAQALDTNEWDIDLATLIEHFRFDPVAKLALILACRTASKDELRSKANALLPDSIQPFLHALVNPSPPADVTIPDEISPAELGSIIEHLSTDPPPEWGEQQSENLKYAIKMRYQKLSRRVPAEVESAEYLDEMLRLPDSKLARAIQNAGPRATSSLDACKEMLANIETSAISYPQVANALLFTVMTGHGRAYDTGVLVQGIRVHRTGKMIDWTDVVQNFDRPELRVTKQQFLGLYNALLPIAKEQPIKFDIQSLLGKTWSNTSPQWSFVAAFCSTTREELDMSQIPHLRLAFQIEDYNDAPDHIRAFAAEAASHPLASRDAVEVLFGTIFRSQADYQEAQLLGIPEKIINTNMTEFLCAASGVSKTTPLQDQALKQLFFPFLLKKHANYDFVMHTLWMRDNMWVASRLVEYYQTEPLLLEKIFEHAEEHGWTAQLLTLPSAFAVDLACYAHGKGQCDLFEWSEPHIQSMGGMNYAKALYDFMRTKCDDETAIQKEGAQPTTTTLSIKTVFCLLRIIENSAGEELGSFYRQFLQLYPRLFNYGEDEQVDKLLDELDAARGHALPDDANSEMEVRYKQMYGGDATPDAVIAELKDIKHSTDSNKQNLFAAMLQGLFDEYNCFGEYPNEALATTAVLFGGLIQFNVLSFVAEQAAISMVFEAVSETTQEDPMYKFGLQAMIHLLGRLKDWPHLADRILQTPSLRNTQAAQVAEEVMKELQQENVGLNGDTVNGITNGALDEEYPVDSPTPPFSAIHTDPPLRPEVYEEPDEEVSDKVMFVLNNVSKRNLEDKFKDLASTLEDKHHAWFARYLVEELAKMQPNFQSLYLQLLENFDKKILWQEVLRETYVSCAKMLNAQSTMDSTTERTNLKNLAGWLGSLTLARNQPILHRNLSFKDLLIEGHDTQRLLVAIPFTCKALIHAARSKVFRPPNPWLEELLHLLSELYHCFELRLNLKFEIEVLCKDLSMDIKEIEPSDVIRSRPLLPADNLLQPYVPDTGPDGFGDVHIMGLSKRAPNERFSPDAVIRALPDLQELLTMPPTPGNVRAAELQSIFVQSAQRAIYEIIAPVVERSVTIAAISTAELVQKDFATESDIEKLRNSAHTVVKALSGSLALVTCKEPLRMSITNNIRILASSMLPEQLPEGQILMFVNDNIDRVCSLVEDAAEEHSLAEIDAQMAQAMEDRRRHNEQRPNENYNIPPVSRWAQMIPDPFRQDPNAGGLNRQQLGLYEDFGRQARIAPTAHATTASQDARGQLPTDVLGDGYLPSLPTPAEAPAQLTRPTPQQRAMAMQQQDPHQVNGYIDSHNIGQRTLELMQDLQQAAREATEEHLTQLTDASPVRQIYHQLCILIDTSMANRDSLATAAGQQALMIIYSEAQQRLEVEVFCRFATVMCKISVQASRHLITYLASTDDDKIFKAIPTAVLLSEHVLDIGHIDALSAKALKMRRDVVLPFLRDLLDEVLLNEDTNVLRSDFAQSYEALGQWINEEPGNEGVREIISKLQIPAGQQNGVPSPPQQDDLSKQDRLEYIFEEWVRLQRKETPERSYLAFVRQLEQRHVISTPDEATTFFRSCLDSCVADFERAIGRPYASQDEAYIHTDALAKLMAFIVVYQNPVNGAPQPNKARSLAAILRVVIIVMLDQIKKQGERWQSRIYFRLFSSMLCEIRGARHQVEGGQEVELYKTFAQAVLVLQPRYVEAFTFPWLALLSHRLFVPALLGGSGRSNGGWEIFTKLITTLLTNLGDMMHDVDNQPVIQDFYRGVLRFLLMLHHDYREFLIENHVQLNSAVSQGCAQLHNIINSAVGLAVVNDQPDPFTPGLKINRLDQVRQAPVVSANVEQILAQAGIKDTIERVCAGGHLKDEDYAAASGALNAADDKLRPLYANAMAVFIAMKVTPAASVFSAAQAPARLLEWLLREDSPQLRLNLINAMINQVRYVNSHTHYYSTALQHMFTIGSEDLQEQIMRVLVERLMAPRPHPWGLLVMMLELIKNQTYDIWSLGWMKTAPEIRFMLQGLSESQERASRGGMM
ncbi:Not1-domain-containing protein [Teratosphaeria nubilosa]|uniref:General negative regulator of transcription subunit 1 n=1 Tax=Teratosphaeria nubilosa TaxID=161662 RepID=A0A6G1KZ50_9PEZI|nr:Not1-domain-containing protein [Teratosphaeria nubilosa]